MTLGGWIEGCGEPQLRWQAYRYGGRCQYAVDLVMWLFTSLNVPFAKLEQTSLNILAVVSKKVFFLFLVEQLNRTKMNSVFGQTDIPIIAIIVKVICWYIQWRIRKCLCVTVTYAYVDSSHVFRFTYPLRSEFVTGAMNTTVTGRTQVLMCRPFCLWPSDQWKVENSTCQSVGQLVTFCCYLSGLLTILLQSIGNTNTAWKKYCQYQYQYKFLISIAIQITILLQYCLTNTNTLRLHSNEANDHILLLILVCNVVKWKHKSNTFQQLLQF